ncbi:MAG: hypothetical protein ABI051_02595 [Vicinamibacterales bacterium]
MNLTRLLSLRAVAGAALLLGLAVGGPGAGTTGGVVGAAALQQPASPPGGRPVEGREGRGGPGYPWPWWNDADVRKEIGLSAEKAKKINDIYQRRADDLKKIVDEWMKQSDDLQKMTKAALVDEGTYALQVLHVESLRSRLNESRTVLLYRMYRELQPDQYKKLQDIFARRSASFGRGR